MIVKCDSKLSAVSPFKYYFLHEASQFVSPNLFLYEYGYYEIIGST